MKSKAPDLPSQRGDTVRHSIVELLAAGPATARQISAGVGIPEREVGAHLDHIRRSLHRQGGRLEIIPARCHDCAYIFRGRERLSRPGRCPRCRGTSLAEPLFQVCWP